MTTAVVDPFPTLTGRREPHHLSAVEPFAGSEKHGTAAVALADRVENPLMPWEADHLLGTLRWNSQTGLWVHSDVCLICPRQNGKSEILLFRCLYGLFVLGEKIVFSAQRWKTGKKIAERMIAIINRRPSLKARLAKKPTLSFGQGQIVLKSGAVIDFITRSEDSGRGFDEIDLVIFDEGYNLDDGAVSALAPAQLASKNPQTIYASSAVNAQKHPNGHVLATIRRDGLNKEPGLYFAEHMAPDEMPRDEEETWRYANPSYGVIQTFEKIRRLVRRFATPAGRRSFDIEILGRGDWPRATDDVDTVFAADDLLTDSAPALTGSVAISVDRSYDDRHWAIGAAQWTTAGLIHGEIGFIGPSSNAAMVLRLVQIVRAWDPVVIMIDRRSPAKVLVPLLVAEGVVPEETTTPDMALACQGIEDDITDGQMSFSDQTPLIESITGATKRFLPQGDFAWARPDGAVIAPLVTMTLARLGLQRFGLEPEVQGSLPAVPGAEVDGASDFEDDMWSPDDNFDPMTTAF